MARMYPDRPTVETQSNAERKLYYALRDQLPSAYVVFHSVRWQSRDTTQGIRDGEADFIIVHPTDGMLVVEVKGGVIRCDGATGEWYSNDYQIKDPFRQASKNMYSLLDKLADLRWWHPHALRLGHAVAFPDVAVKRGLRLDAPKEIILDGTDMSAIQSWVSSAMSYYRGQSSPARRPQERIVEELINLLSPSWELRSIFAIEFADEHDAIIRLTEEQFLLLDSLTGRRRVAISGCAGSGKTMLAVEQARRLADQGFRVLLTCFNKNLADFLRRDPRLPAAVDVCNFHALCRDLAERAGLGDRLHRHPETRTWYDVELPNLLLEAIDHLGGIYDAIIVDEGQDFQSDWWLPIQCLLHDEKDGILYVFYDDNQNLYRTQLNLPANLDHYPLTRNCRTTQHIHRTFVSFYRSQHVPTVRGPEGRQPVVRYYESKTNLMDTVRQAVYQLVNEEGIDCADITILTPWSKDKSVVWRAGSLGKFRLTDVWGRRGNEIYTSTIHAFKGLESPVVILAEVWPPDRDDLERLLYVGCSRARNHLIVIGHVDLPEPVRARLSAASAQ